MKKKEDKIKNIFDWLQHITLYKTPSLEFTDNDWEKFNSYMVHRFVSMHVYYVEIADYAQSMLPTMKKQIYNFYRIDHPTTEPVYNSYPTTLKL